VHQAVEDGVGQRGVADEIVPFVDGELAGGQCRAGAVPVFEDLQPVAALFGGQLGQSPVIQDQDLGLGEGGEQLGVTPVTCTSSDPI